MLIKKQKNNSKTNKAKNVHNLNIILNILSIQQLFTYTSFVNLPLHAHVTLTLNCNWVIFSSIKIEFIDLEIINKHIYMYIYLY